MRIIGIDPGVKGAWALVVDGCPERVGELPMAGEGSRGRLAAGILAGLLSDMAPDLVVVELLTAMPQDRRGTIGTFKIGMSYGGILAVVNVLGKPLELVTPPVWKRHFRLLGTDKEASRQKALDLAPGLTALLSRKLDQNRAEAILIGLYAYATYDIPRAA